MPREVKKYQRCLFCHKFTSFIYDEDTALLSSTPGIGIACKKCNNEKRKDRNRADILSEDSLPNEEYHIAEQEPKVELESQKPKAELESLKENEELAKLLINVAENEKLRLIIPLSLQLLYLKIAQINKTLVSSKPRLLDGASLTVNQSSIDPHWLIKPHKMLVSSRIGMDHCSWIYYQELNQIELFVIK